MHFFGTLVVYFLLLVIVKTTKIDVCMGGIVSGAPRIATGSVVPRNCAAGVISSGKALLRRLGSSSSGHICGGCSRVSPCVKRTFITVRSRHFCGRGNVSVRKVVHTNIGNITRNFRFARKTDALARRLVGGGMFPGFVGRDECRQVRQGVRRRCLTLGVRGRVDGGRVLRTCVGAVGLKRKYLKIRATTRHCFGGSTGSLALSRYTIVTTVARDPSGLGPIDGPRTGTGEQRGILGGVGRRNSVAGRRCSRTVTSGMCSHVSRATSGAATSGPCACFVSTIVGRVISSLMARGDCARARTCGLLCDNNLAVGIARSTSVRTVYSSRITGMKSCLGNSARCKLSCTLAVRETSNSSRGCDGRRLTSCVRDT